MTNVTSDSTINRADPPCGREGCPGMPPTGKRWKLVDARPVTAEDRAYRQGLRHASAVGLIVGTIVVKYSHGGYDSLIAALNPWR